jgi:hypothetical protein
LINIKIETINKLLDKKLDVYYAEPDYELGVIVGYGELRKNNFTLKTIISNLNINNQNINFSVDPEDQANFNEIFRTLTYQYVRLINYLDKYEKLTDDNSFSCHYAKEIVYLMKDDRVDEKERGILSYSSKKIRSFKNIYQSLDLENLS